MPYATWDDLGRKNPSERQDIFRRQRLHQFHWRGDGNKADYAAIAGVMAAVKARFPGKRIGYPKIGAGLAGGDWARIVPIIEAELAGEDHTFVEFVPAVKI